MGAGLFLVLIFLNLTYIYACYAGISEAYYYVEQELKDSCFKAAVILGILTVVCSIGIGFIFHDYLKRGPLKSNFKISKPDKIWTEINVFGKTVSAQVPDPSGSRRNPYGWSFMADSRALELVYQLGDFNGRML